MATIPKLKTVLAKFPKMDIILAGFLAQIALRLMIYIEDEDTQFPYEHMGYDSGPDICGSDRIYWLALILISAGVAVLTTWKNKGGKYAQGAVTFVASFLLNLSGDSLGFLAMECTAMKWKLHTVVIFENVYSGIALSITSIALIAISVHLWRKPAAPTAARFPDLEVILLGYCAHFTVWHIVSVIGLKFDYSSFCDNRGLGSWLHLLVLSAILAIVTYMKGTGNVIVTFFSSFLLNLTVGGTGRLAIVCGIDGPDMEWDGYHYGISTITGRVYSSATMIVNAVLAAGITVWFLRSTSEASTNPPEMEDENQNSENPMLPENLVQDTTPV